MNEKDLFKQNQKLTQEEKQWEQEKNLIERKEKLDSEKNKLKKKKSSISTSKLLIAFLFINCTIIEIFTGWATIKMLSIALMTGTGMDFAPLVALIGAIVGEVFGYAVYSLKATKENTAGGLVYDSVMKNNNNNSDNNIAG